MSERGYPECSAEKNGNGTFQMDAQHCHSMCGGSWQQGEMQVEGQTASRARKGAG